MRKKKIKVLFALNSFGTGGSERVVLDIARRLNRNMFEPYVLSINPPCQLGVLFSQNDIWNRCFTKSKGVDIRLMLEIYKIIRKKKIDIVNAHHFSPLIHISLGAILNRCPLVYADHTIMEIQKIPFYWKILGNIVVRMCYGVIGISYGCTRQLRKTFFVSSNKAHTIMNAIDLDRFNQDKVERNELRESLNIKSTDDVIGIVGNLRSQKNHKNILKSCKILMERGNSAKFLIVGDGPLKKELINLSTKLGIQDQVIFLGARLDVDALYKAMDIYCLCSNYEGLPLTILEAMASKLPVVGTNVVGIREIIKHGETGMLVELNNPDALSKMFVKLLNNKSDAERLAGNGYRYVTRHHHMTPWIRTYENYFIQAVQQK